MNKLIDKAYIFVDHISTLPKLKCVPYNKLWHIGKFWEEPEEGKIIVYTHENRYNKMEIVRVSSDLDTDEILKWTYLEDLI
jgi:uncharacterized metal-binding protein